MNLSAQAKRLQYKPRYPYISPEGDISTFTAAIVEKGYANDFFWSEDFTPAFIEEVIFDLTVFFFKGTHTHIITVKCVRAKVQYTIHIIDL